MQQLVDKITVEEYHNYTISFFVVALNLIFRNKIWNKILFTYLVYTWNISLVELIKEGKVYTF